VKKKSASLHPLLFTGNIGMQPISPTLLQESLLNASPHPADLPGLTSDEVADRVRRGLTNQFRPRSSRTYREILRDNLINVFNITLFVLLLIMIALGESMDTLFAGSTVLLNIVIGLFQEIRAKRTLDRFAALATGTVRVKRASQTFDAPLEQVVQDDLIEIAPGDKIVVDGPCVWQDSLEVDESLITGESDPISKQVGDTLTSGSFITAGRAIMRAEKIGAESFANKLSRTAKGFKLIPTPIQQKINAIVTISVVGMAVFGPLLLIAGVTERIPFRDTVRNVVVLVTTFVPQGLVLATTLALSFGAIRISRHRTLVQRINAVESMANVTVLCFDKTGTLTQNKLSVVDLLPLGAYTIPYAKRVLAQYVTTLATQNKTAGAIEDYVGRSNSGPMKVSELPFTSTRKWGASTFADGATLLLGAPEILIEDSDIRWQANQLATQGLRVLAFAGSQAAPVDGQLPAERHPIALIAVRDMPREDIQVTLQAFTDRGVQLKVISGDNAETVRAIARTAGLNATHVVTGAELEAMTATEFDQAVKNAGIFARVTPETKRKIVSALAQQGEYVAMVGDGVNDVPALKAARLGIAMNDGAQIAKDVADLVLLNNALTTLPLALSEGYKTTQKIYATVKIFLTRNLYLILLFIMAGFIGLPFPGHVRQISWSAITTTGLPAGLIALELTRPHAVRSFQRNVLGYIIFAGLIGSVAMTIAYVASYLISNHNVVLARAMFTLTATVYGTLIFWEVHGVVLFEPITFKRRPREALTGLGLAIVAVGVPRVYPEIFEIPLIPLPYWFGLVILVIVAAYTLWRSTSDQSKLLAPFRMLMTK
jgi:cation-transporting ATPase E